MSASREVPAVSLPFSILTCIGVGQGLAAVIENPAA
jgi:hypothetical protein